MEPHWLHLHSAPMATIFQMFKIKLSQPLLTHKKCLSKKSFMMTRGCCITSDEKKLMFWDIHVFIQGRALFRVRLLVLDSIWLWHYHVHSLCIGANTETYISSGPAVHLETINITVICYLHTLPQVLLHGKPKT